MTTRNLHLLLLPLLLALALHGFGLSWLQANLSSAQPLVPMREPLFTRVLEPEAPPAIAAPLPVLPRPPSKRVASRAVAPPAESVSVAVAPVRQDDTAEVPASADDASNQATPASIPAPISAPDSAPVMAEPAAVPEKVAQPPAPSELFAASPTSDPLASWPLDTRLSYKLGGFYRGELHGDAQVVWQRDQASYQVMLTFTTLGLTLATITSQGEATAQGLVPRVYEEKLPGGLRRAEFGEGQVKFQNGQRADLPPGAQDTVSQLVDMAHRFANGRSVLATGVPVQVWLARPGGLDEWIYDVGELETLHTPTLGPLQAHRLTPRPLARPRGAITAEMWFAPSLQYLPVRVRIALGDGNFADLMIERIEQATLAKPAQASK